MGQRLGPRHTFWSVLGPAEPARFGTGTRAARGGVNPAEPAGAEAAAQAKGAFLFDILGEANRLANRTVSLFAPIRAETGLSGIEVLTLIAIAHAHAPPTVPQVGRSLGHPRQVIQRAVRVLEEAELVRPMPNPGHKRAVLLVATDKGRALGHRVDALALEIVTGVGEGLTLDLATLRTMLDAMQMLRRRLDERLVGTG